MVSSPELPLNNSTRRPAGLDVSLRAASTHSDKRKWGSQMHLNALKFPHRRHRALSHRFAGTLSSPKQKAAAREREIRTDASASLTPNTIP